MALTPEDVVKKEFSKPKGFGRNGYDEIQVDDFLDDLPAQLAALTACADLGDVARLAHVVKGTSSTMAAPRLAAAAEALEAAALGGDVSGVADRLAEVERQAVAAAAALRATVGVVTT